MFLDEKEMKNLYNVHISGHDSIVIYDKENIKSLVNSKKTFERVVIAESTEKSQWLFKQGTIRMDKVQLIEPYVNSGHMTPLVYIFGEALIEEVR